MTWEILRGDCVDRMRELDDCSIDSLVCDDLEAGTAGEHLVCADLGLDLGSDMNAPGIKRVLSIGRRVRREAGS